VILDRGIEAFQVADQLPRDQQRQRMQRIGDGADGRRLVRAGVPRWQDDQPRRALLNRDLASETRAPLSEANYNSVGANLATIPTSSSPPGRRSAPPDDRLQRGPMPRDLSMPRRCQMSRATGFGV
jgi:hypothetical protein